MSTPPYGSPGRLRTSPHRHRTAIALIAAGIAVVAVSLALALATALGWHPTSSAPATHVPGGATSANTPAGGPTSRSTSSQPSGRPSPIAMRASSSPSQRSSRRGEPTGGGTLEDNRIYGLQLSPGEGSCRITVRNPRPPLKDSALAPYVRRVAGCLTDVLAGPLAKRDITLTEPKVMSFKATVSTPCGRLTAKAAPAYYCAASHTIYWPVSADDRSDAFSYLRLGYVALTAHEFGHHLQAAAGIVDAYGARRSDKSSRARLTLTRRLELQAECFEGVFLAYLEDSLHLTAQDRYELRQWHTSTGDEDPPADRRPDHGTSQAQTRWLFRGLAGADFARCNTWSASASSVR